MCIDELAVLRVVLHACTHTAPHGLVRRRVVAIVTRTGRCEVDVAAVLGMLRREDVVERGQLKIVGIAGLRVAAVQRLRQLQHIVGVASLWAVDVVDEVHAGFLAGEMLTTAVAAESQRALASHHVPEELCGLVVGLVAGHLGYTLEAHHLWHLRVGVHIVEVVNMLCHRCQQTAVREPLGGIEILPVAI